ncbi:MAG: phosphoglycerate kinase [Candidatus Nanohaloarchaea archaeon]|nr:phosphoglycerate kinase [Candidatus Nanohaloarchaea archaeon]
MKGIEEAELEGKNVLLRSDLNLTLDEGKPQKDLRFERYMETVQELQERGARTLVLAHQGRPGRDDFLSLGKHAELMREHLDSEVEFVEGFFGGDPETTMEGMEDGDVALNENVRFLSEELNSAPPEIHANDFMVKHFAEVFDIYVNDAFSAAHRSHASLVGFPPVMESCAGKVMEEELENCGRARDEVENPVLVLGGEKPSDLVSMLDRMVERADKVLLGGVPGELAMHYRGADIEEKRKWIEERSMDSGAKHLAEMLDEYPEKFEVPTDVKTDSGNHSSGNVPDGEKPWDIGKETEHHYKKIVEDADSVVMKGPLGAFERGFDEGSKTVMEGVANCEGHTVLGGGHTSSLVKLFGFSLDDFSHVSIAGGAFVRYMSGEKLPAVEALKSH